MNNIIIPLNSVIMHLVAGFPRANVLRRLFRF